MRAPLVLTLLLSLALPSFLSAQQEAAGAPAGTYERTLRTDVAGASYYELLAWCRELGLDDTGNRQALQSRLLRRLGLVELAREPVQEARIEIVSARETDYFTLEQVGEEYVVLRGTVVVKVKDRGRDSVHTIEADSLVYNQTTGQMTAKGGARYVLSKGGKDEVFEGESLSFDTRTLEGVFYDGSVERERAVGGRSLEFTFRGSAISRLSNDTVILEDGTITSSRAADPYYVVHVNRAWILADGEWAVLGATLRVGRVPVLYLPFFFYPGDEIVFHPSLEFRAREGTVLQTTTYLIGERKRESDSLSLLQLAQEAGSGSQRTRRGMFLTVDKTSPAPAPDRSLFLMADVYSRLGAMVGIDARFPPTYSGRLGIGVSRSIFRDTSGAYTPFWSDPEEGYKSVWNSANVLGLAVPVRFGLESALKVQQGVAGASGSVELYSDPYFPSDFYARSERLKWDSLLGAATASTTASGAKSSLTWTASGNLNLASIVRSPLASELSIRSLEASAFIGSRTRNTTADPLTAADPARSFYFPLSAKAPGLSLGARGTLLSLPAKTPASSAAPARADPKKGVPPVRENPGKGIRVPWETETETQEPAAETTGADAADRLEEGLLGPLPKANAASSVPARGSTLVLTYSVTPRAAVEYPFASEAWLSPEDVDYATSSVNVSAQSDARLGLSLSLFARLIAVSSELQASGNVRTRFPGTAPVEAVAWQRQLLSDYQATRLTLSQRSSVTIQPLLGVSSLQGSTVAYTFGWQFLGTTYDSLLDGAPVFVTAAGELDRDSVSAHSLTANLVYKPYLASQSLSLTAVLPPEEVTLRGQATLTLGKLTTRLSLGVRQVEAVWTPDPLTASGTFQPFTWLTATGEVGLDVDAMDLTRIAASLKLRGLSSSFTALRMLPVNPFGVATGEPEAFLPSQFLVQYAIPSQKVYLWRDRIKAEADVRSAWNWNLQRFTQNELTFNLSLSLSVYKFLTLSFSTESYNNRMYRYFPGYAEALGGEWINPVYDLLRSFNFANTADRYLSGFKVRKLTISAVHHMEDWDFRVDYQGKPALKTGTDGTRQYEWDRTLTVLLEWKPLPLIHARAQSGSAGFTFGG